MFKKMMLPLILFAALAYTCSPTKSGPTAGTKTAGNPIINGWYADPEGVIFNNKYWIYPTYSAPYNQQVFMDAFRLPILLTGQSINVLSILPQLNGQRGLCGRLLL